jgi:hypothetical protein
MYFLLSKIDIGNNMRLFIVPVLEHYERQGSLHKPLNLRMDFSHPVKKEHITQANEESEAEETSVNIYRHHWMDGKLVFNDGVKIDWEIEDVVNKKPKGEKSAVNDPSAKYQIQHVLNMHFSAPKDTFTVANKDIMETDDGKFYIVSIHKKDISESLDEGMSPEVFISSVDEGYHFVGSKKTS